MGGGRDEWRWRKMLDGMAEMIGNAEMKKGVFRHRQGTPSPAPTCSAGHQNKTA
jgi:hypothetical protein